MQTGNLSMETGETFCFFVHSIKEKIWRSYGGNNYFRCWARGMSAAQIKKMVRNFRCGQGSFADAFLIVKLLPARKFDCKSTSAAFCIAYRDFTAVCMADFFGNGKP